MSLTAFVKQPEVVAKLKPLRPKGPRTLKIEQKVPPRTKKYMLVGVAFDYFFRFELKRLKPNVIERQWVAERALELIRYETSDGGVIRGDW